MSSIFCSAEPKSLHWRPIKDEKDDIYSNCHESKECKIIGQIFRIQTMQRFWTPPRTMIIIFSLQNMTLCNIMNWGSNIQRGVTRCYLSMSRCKELQNTKRKSNPHHGSNKIVPGSTIEFWCPDSFESIWL